MRRLPALVIALAAVAVVTAATAAGAIAWANQANDPYARTGAGMMAADPSDTPGWWDDQSWGPGRMGMMAPAGAAGEPEYLAEMVAHHQEAVVAAGELARSDRPEMRAFGESIVTTQSAQIQQMQAWLKEWYPDQPTSVDYEPMMRDLSGLSGDRRDQTFLQDMIGHHMVAVMMSQHLLGRGDTDHEQVAQLARTIRDDQHAEIIQMHRWLALWFDADSPGGMGCGTWSGRGWGMS
jgi:uncharacterized protein (DUF305 family)